MSDTGAPWNLPYPLASDLVRDGAADIEALAEATADGLSAAGSAGIGSNVVQTVKTDTFETTSGSYVDVTGMAATITPSAASSKILVIIHAAISAEASQGAHIQIVRETTALYLGDGSGSRTRSSASYFIPSGVDATFSSTATLVFLDEPASTSPTTYKLQMRRGTSGSAFFNRDGIDVNDGRTGRPAASITVVEVAT